VKTLQIKVQPDTAGKVWHVLLGSAFVAASFQSGEDPYLDAIRYARKLAGTLAPFCDVDVAVQESSGTAGTRGAL